MQLPPDLLVADMTRGPDPRLTPGVWAIGRYDEKRSGIYNTELFAGVRDVHMGIDLFAPVGIPIFAFSDGEVWDTAYNSADGDYGHTLITRHVHEGKDLYALFGHLSPWSIKDKKRGDRVDRGAVIAWVGDVHENGGWPETHVHFQISPVAPASCDMPGVVATTDRENALVSYPDPRIILGAIY